MGLASFLIILSDLLAELLLPIPMTLSSVGLKVLVPKVEMLLSGETTMISFN